MINPDFTPNSPKLQNPDQMLLCPMPCSLISLVDYILTRVVIVIEYCSRGREGKGKRN
jgi:hypothetical protein